MIEELLDVMIALSMGEMTMVVVAHEVGFSREVADEIIPMDGGRNDWRSISRVSPLGFSQLVPQAGFQLIEVFPCKSLPPTGEDRIVVKKGLPPQIEC